MRVSLYAAAVLLTFVVAVQFASAATILSSPDVTQNFTSTNHIVTGPAGGASVLITQDVGHDPAFGPWHKFLINGATAPAASPPHSISSGVDVGVSETITNLGGVAWSQWTEKVLSRTTISTFNDSPGYQFRNGSLIVEANYGSGFTVLTSGVHYNLVATPAPGIGFDPTGFELIALNFQPGFLIGPTHKLRLTQNVFEVFGDGDVWLQGQAAEFGQFPSVPEPGAATIAAFAAAMLLRRRRATA